MLVNPATTVTVKAWVRPTESGPRLIVTREWSLRRSAWVKGPTIYDVGGAVVAPDQSGLTARQVSALMDTALLEALGPARGAA